MKEEAKLKLSLTNKGKRWFNDGYNNYLIKPEYKKENWNFGKIKEIKQ